MKARMTWQQRLDRAAIVGEFSQDDILPAFNREANLLATFGIATDEHGQALDAMAQLFNDEFGWAVLSNRVGSALRCYQALAERAAMQRDELAA